MLRLSGVVLVVYALFFPPVTAAADGLPTSAEVEARLDSILYTLERAGELTQALAAYREVERELLARIPAPSSPDYREHQCVLSYSLLRQGNMLRQLGQADEALRLAERELEAARACGDPLTEARTEFSFGTTLFASGDGKRGRIHLDRALELFSAHEGEDFQQGQGWYWIIRADLARAGLREATPREVISYAETALQLLLPLANWAGVARAYSAFAHGLEAGGESDAAAGAVALQARYERLANEGTEN